MSRASVRAQPTPTKEGQPRPASPPDGGQEPEAGAFDLRVNFDAVLLRVDPPGQGQRRVSLQDVSKALRALPVSRVDETALDRALEEPTGSYVKIGTIEDRDARAHISFDDNHLTAFLTVDPPSGKGKAVSFDPLMEAVRAQGIVHGIYYNRLGRVVHDRIYDRKIVVARGTPPEEGVDGRVAFTFALQPREVEFSADGMKNVDLRQIDRFDTAREGDLLATLFPPREGKPGVSVHNTVLMPRPVQSAELIAGENVQLSTDARKFFATAHGLPLLHRRTLSVSRALEVHDVDYNTGNISFQGSVLVRGSIAPGFTVRAEEDVRVGGSVGPVILQAGRDVWVQGGMLGQGKGRIEAGRDVQARFVQESAVVAGRNVKLTEYLMHSTTRAKGYVQVQKGAHGTLVGGSVEAQRLIVAAVIGSWSHTRTRLQVGVDPETYSKYRRLEEKNAALGEELAALTKDLTFLQAASAAQGPEATRRKGQMEALLRRMQQLHEEQQAVVREMHVLEEAFSLDWSSAIYASQTVHPGVVIEIAGRRTEVMGERMRVKFHADEGDIQIDGYTAPVLND